MDCGCQKLKYNDKPNFDRDDTKETETSVLFIYLFLLKTFKFIKGLIHWKLWRQFFFIQSVTQLYKHSAGEDFHQTQLTFRQPPPPLVGPKKISLRCWCKRTPPPPPRGGCKLHNRWQTSRLNWSNDLLPGFLANSLRLFLQRGEIQRGEHFSVVWKNLEDLLELLKHGESQRDGGDFDKVVPDVFMECSNLLYNCLSIFKVSSFC